MGSDAPRAIWLAQWQRNTLLEIGALQDHAEYIHLIESLLDQWDTAPADPVEALRRRIVDDCFERGSTHLPLDEQIASVLAALRYPTTRSDT